MNEELPEELNEQCTECNRWGGIKLRSELGGFQVRFCSPCIIKYMARPIEDVAQYKYDLLRRLVFAHIQTGGNA
jgi:hypothetical protein